MNSNNTLSDLMKFLKQKSVIFGVYPNVSEFLGFLQEAKQKKKIIRLMYGETYDTFGITIDSLKYYLFLSLLHEVLEQEGFSVESTVLIADAASILNKSANNKEELLSSGSVRIKQIKKIVEVFDLKIKPVLMSDLFKDKKLQENIEKVKAYSQSNKKVQVLFEKTVLQNKISQEKQVGFKYASEAVATALQFDIKIGPPREQYYDKAAKIIGKELSLGMVYGVYLKPTYPLGKDFSFFISNPEIEEFGITPYKAGSNKLQDFRILLGKISDKTIEELVNTSFISKDLSLANPVVDINFIADMAKHAFDKNVSLPFYSKDLINEDNDFKLQVIKKLQKYVLQPLEKGGYYE